MRLVATVKSGTQPSRRLVRRTAAHYRWTLGAMLLGQQRFDLLAKPSPVGDMTQAEIRATKARSVARCCGR